MIGVFGFCDAVGGAGGRWLEGDGREGGKEGELDGDDDVTL